MAHGWQSIGRIPAKRLVEPRIQLHYAAQAVTSVGKAFAKPEPDFGHASFEWVEANRGRSPGLGFLAGRPVEADARRLRAFLRLGRPSVGLVDSDLGPIAELELEGRSLAGAFEWLRERASEAGLDGSRLALKLPPDLPAHPLSSDASFTFPDPDACTELAAWYRNADLVTREVTQAHPRSSSVRCWPHHFDLAALVRLTDRSDEDAPCVGIGFSPGESAIDQPYLYVSPWPYPPPTDLPAAPAGSRWHTEGWVGLYLTADALEVASGPADQERRARAFLAEALAASVALMQPTSRLAGRAN